MNFRLFSISLLLMGTLVNSYASEWNINYIRFEKSTIRTGIKHHTGPSYRGAVLYLEGLGDSMLNHEPLFNQLSSSGYDVIAFDYRGQGGSGGSMNSTRIRNINELGNKVWKKYKSPLEKKIILGWSTGGLAGYRYAFKESNSIKAVILIAPGIAPYKVVGENTFWSCLSPLGVILKRCKINRITKESLTQAKYINRPDPHVEGIRPNSPVKVPAFAINLLRVAARSQKWDIPSSVPGIVYLSSPEDSYVNASKTIDVLRRNAAHFEYHQFGDGALHELDNEIEVIADYLRNDIIRFLASL